MADALSYQLKLVDGMSGPANSANKALAALQKQIKAEEQELARLNKAQRNLNKDDVVDIATSKQLKQQISQKGNALASLQQQMVQLGQAGTKDIGAATESVEGLGSELGLLADPAAAAAAAVLALGAAFAALVYKGASIAIQAAEAKQDTLDLLDAMLGSAQAANDVYGKIEDLTGKVAISQERATGLARELSAAGITNADALTDAIKTIGQVESVLGNEAGGKIQTILEKAVQTGKFSINPKQLVGTGVQVQKLYEQIAKNTGKGVKQVEAELKAGKISAEVGVKALTQVVGAKFAGPAEGQVKDLGNQLQHLKDNIGKLFEDVDTGGFLDALHDVLSVFDQSTESGKALKAVLTAAFNGVFSVAQAVLPYIKTGLRGLVIIGLQVAIALKPLVKTLRDAFGGESKSGVDTLAAALSTVGEYVAKFVGYLVVVAQFKPLWYAIAAAVAIALTPFALFLAIMIAINTAIAFVISKIVDLITWFVSLGPAAAKTGGDIVDGLIDGFVNMGPNLLKAVSFLASKAIGAFKKVFGIASPSKVMMGMGVNLMKGLDMGINVGAPAANDTLAHAVEPPPTLGGASGGNVSHTTGDISIVIQVSSTATAAELKEMMPGIMADALEQAGLTVGTSQAA